MPRHPQFLPYVALGAVCLFWGTTYLGIRMALEEFPPLLLIATRFLLSGGLMLGWAIVKGIPLPRGREFWLTALFGICTLGFGNGGVILAEQTIPSGLAALFVTTGPFWLVGLDALIPGGVRLHGPTLVGMLVGLLGVLLLLAPSGTGGAVPLGGFLLCQVASAGWSLGSIAMKRLQTKTHPILNGAVQQFATGVFYLLPALLIPAHPLAVGHSGRGVWALFYLVIFGSIVGYSAYVYALARLPVAIVSIYTYINPIVAVILGWLIYREPFGWRGVAAMLVIFLGVWLVKRSQR